MTCLRRLLPLSLALAACGTVGSPHPALSLPEHNPHPPLKCTGMNEIVLRDVTIISPTDGVEVSGYCNVTLYDSHIVGERFGVSVRKYGQLTLINSTIEGRRGWAFATDFGRIDVRSGQIAGGTRVHRYANVQTDRATQRLD